MGVFCPDSGCIEVREVFENAPAANVKPVVYGKWMEWGFNIRCSVCGDEPYFERSNMPKYCPNCGAYMRYGAL